MNVLLVSILALLAINPINGKHSQRGDLSGFSVSILRYIRQIIDTVL